MAIAGAAVAVTAVLIPIALEGKIDEGTTIDFPYVALALWGALAAPGAWLILRAVAPSPSWQRERYFWMAGWVLATALSSLLFALYGNVGFDRSEPVVQHASFVRRFTRNGKRGPAQQWTVYRLTDGTELTTTVPLSSTTVEVHSGAFGARWYRR